MSKSGNSNKVICLFGGTGFLGRNLLRPLCELDYRIKIATRNPFQRGYRLKTQSDPGQIELFKVDINNPDEVKRFLNGSFAAINLCGILFQNSKQKFSKIHTDWPYLLSNLCNELGVIKRLIHISALGVKENHKSLYMSSKLQGEKLLAENFKSSVILRPGICVGPGDRFLTRFASIANISPILPIIGNGKQKLSIIYVHDVCKAIVKALELNNSEPKIFELGNEIYTFKELMEILLKEIKKKRLLLNIPFSIAKFPVSYFLQLFPNPIISVDQVEILKHSNVVSGNYPGIKNLGISGTALKNILPKYLSRFKSPYDTVI